MLIFPTGNNNLKGPARTLWAPLKGAFISPGLQQMASCQCGVVGLPAFPLTWTWVCCQFALFHYFLVEQCWERNVLAVVGGVVTWCYSRSKCTTGLPSSLWERLGLGSDGMALEVYGQPVCLREVAVHQWLADLGSGLEMLPFERLFTVFLWKS